MNALVLTVLIASAPEALEWREVVDAALKSHPNVRAARLAVDVAEGGVLEADGAFDPKLKAELNRAAVGYYDEQLLKAELAQRLPFTLGPELSLGYRNGADFAPYDGKQVTSAGGELFAGVSLNLARDLLTDDVRTKAAVARTKTDKARAKLREVELKVAEGATSAWLEWALKKQKRDIARGLLQLAETRQKFIARQVDSGALPRIDLVDNQQQIFNRKAKLVDSEAALRSAALKLSLYLRDASGQPIVPDAARAPRLDRATEEALLDQEEALALALAQRPELKVIERLLEATRLELAQADNALLPEVKLSATFRQDFGAPRDYGFSDSRNETDLFGRVTFSWPTLSRKARGRRAALSSLGEQLEVELGFLRDVIKQEIARAHLEARAAAERVTLDVSALEGARTLEDAERKRFRAGTKDLLSVNLREERAAKAAEILAEAVFDARLSARVLELRSGASGLVGEDG